MVIAVLMVLGLCFGSFVNAFVWRLHEKRDWVNDRSECVHCHHKLNTIDLIPVLSWIALRGRCRYCRRPISWQYPAVELGMATLFVMSYMAAPVSAHVASVLVFALWLVLLIGLMSLFIYDVRWMLLPSKLIWTFMGVAVVRAAIEVATSIAPVKLMTSLLVSMLIGGGIFYVMYQVSGGKWIGGGDVRLGFLLGVIVGSPVGSVMFIFFAAMLGSLFAAPFMVIRRLNARSLIPFGPFLIAGSVIVVLYGTTIWQWYQSMLVIR